MRKLFFLFSLLLITLPLQARMDYRSLLLKGDFTALEKAFEQEKDLKKLFADEAVIYIHSLIMDGKVPESKEYIDHYRLRFPKDKDLIELERGINLFALNYAHGNYTENQKQHIKFINTQFEHVKAHLSETLKEILDLENEFYLPSKYDYAFTLKNDESSFDLIRKSALADVVAKQRILFPKTKDFLDLAYAYKALAVIKIHESKLDEASRFIKLAQSYVFKMRSIWLIEDLNIFNLDEYLNALLDF